MQREKPQAAMTQSVRSGAGLESLLGPAMGPRSRAQRTGALFLLASSRASLAAGEGAL